MKAVRQLLLLLLVAGFTLQIFFLLKIFGMAVIPPQSSSFQRSETWRIIEKYRSLKWQHSWTSYSDISSNLKRAVIAAEDGDFIYHDGIEWDALEQAWLKNSKAQEIAEQRAKRNTNAANKAQQKPIKPPKIIGGSTISQQLAKNMFLSGERTLFRKGQEFALTVFIELLLSKQKILEIYLNNVEWGEGIFGAEAAAQHYFKKSAKHLNVYESARLAVMLPRPKYYEKNSSSSYLTSRTATIVARLGDAEAP
ncbi:MAG TPA: transglycosylase domain-containing protein [Burkholderiaceae bacterium]|nr:transglycosylase domain-containing protein [Burkholderiaceae bacterium]